MPPYPNGHLIIEGGSIGKTSNLAIATGRPHALTTLGTNKPLRLLQPAPMAHGCDKRKCERLAAPDQASRPNDARPSLQILDQASRSSAKRRDTRPARPGLSHTSTHEHTARKHTASPPRGQRDATLTSTTSGLPHAPHTTQRPHNARTRHKRSSSRPQARDIGGGASALGRRGGRPQSPLVGGEERHRLGRLELRPPPWRVEMR